MAASLLRPGAKSRAGILAILGLLVVGLGAALAVYAFLKSERERELSQWQLRLDWQARQSSASLEGWLAEQTALTQRLANNDTIRLHLTLLEQEAAGPTAEELSYVRNLLQAVALNAGLKLLESGQRLPANVPQFATEGLALVASDGRLVAASAGMPPLTGEVHGLLRERSAGSELVVALDPRPGQALRVLVASPVSRFQEEPGAESETGVILLLRSLSNEAATALIEPGRFATPGAEGENFFLLARRNGSGQLLLSTAPDAKRGVSEGGAFSLDNQEYFLAAALRQPGQFLQLRALDGRPLLLSSSEMKGLPWVTVATADREAALAASEARLNTLATLFFGGILVSILLILLFWRQGASAKAAALSRQMAASLEQEQRARTLLEGISDAITDEILALDGRNHVIYANGSLAKRLGVEPEDLKGKSLAAAMGPAAAEEIAEGVEEARQAGRSVARELVAEEERDRVIRGVFVPVGGAQPDEEAATSSPASIVVLQDITEPLRARQALAEAQGRLVRALVKVINQRDPFTAEQSARASKLAEELAEAMELPAEEVEAAAEAALLVDLGKIKIPRHLLTKDSALTPEELRLVREAIRDGVKLVEEAGLQPTVLETLRQLAASLGSEERPVDLTGENLLSATKAAALAHNFVALASARGYREGFPAEKALEMVREGRDLKHDEAVLSALAHLYYSGGGKERWRFAGKP